MSSIRVPQSLCRAGFAHCDITPPPGIYHRMWGAASHDRSTGIHRPLSAMALCFQSSRGDEEQFLLSLDHVLFWPTEMNELLDAITEKTGLSRESLSITFTHTHAAGLMDRTRSDLPGGDLIGPYLDELVEKLSEIILQAKRDAKEVCITYGIGHCSLAKHRDFWDGEQFVCGFNPGGKSDDTVIVARITSVDGAKIGVLVNYACHPTTLAWDNTLISPDFPGAMREVIEKNALMPCVFLQGASGDLGPRDGYVGDVDVAERNGRQLGYAVLEVLESLPPPLTKMVYTGAVTSGATLGTWAHQPLDDAEKQEISRWQIRHEIVALPYREDLLTLEQILEKKKEWETKEDHARQSGDEATASACRARVERMTRKHTHQAGLPKGESFPYPVLCWQIGDVIHVAVEGELYQWFQLELRRRFPDRLILVTTLTNGSRVMYLPTAETYGKGIYQESIAVLAKGSLEQLVESVSEMIATWPASETYLS